MKLKKFAALALAGVMAVSMLAGCANKPAEKPTEDPTTDLTAAVVAELNAVEGKKYNYVASNDLTSAMQALQAKYGTYNYDDKISAEELAAVAGNVYTKADLTGARNEVRGSTNTEADVKEVTTDFTATYVAKLGTGIVDTETAVKAIADKVNTELTNDYKASTNTYTLDDVNARVNFTYSDVKVSVYSGVDNDGKIFYAVTAVVTRSGAVQTQNFADPA